MNISIMINQLFDIDFKIPVEDQMERAARAGFQHQDISFWDWSFHPQSPFRGDGWEMWVEKAAAFKNDRNIVFNQAHAPASVMPNDPSLLEEMYLRTIKASAMLGVKWMVFHVIDEPRVYDKNHVKKLKEKNIGLFGRLLEESVKYNVGIALENMHSKDPISIKEGTERYCTRLEDLVELVDSFNSPFMGICWDTGHGNLMKEDQADSIKALGKRIKALHVHDNHGLTDQHLIPLHGNINWEAVMGALYEIGYEGDFNFEASLYLARMPDNCKDISLRLLYEIGKHLVNMKPDKK